MKTLRVLLFIYAIHVVSCMFIQTTFLYKHELEKGHHELMKRDANQQLVIHDKACSCDDQNGGEKRLDDGDDQNGGEKRPDSGDDQNGGEKRPDNGDDHDGSVVRSTSEIIGMVLVAALMGAVLGFILAPFMLYIGLFVLGFTVTGVAVGSIAAWIMSFYGGTIASGSLISILQSMGALGFMNLFGGSLPPLGAIAGIFIAEYILYMFIL